MPIRGQYGKGIADVEILALEGKPTEPLASLRDEPDYQAILADVKADLREQRSAIEAGAAGGEPEPLPEALL